MRVRPMSSCASLRSSGGSASALSSMTSTAVPPQPNATTGPKVGSSAIPTMSSCAFGLTIIGWMVTPLMRASGRAARPGDNVVYRFANGIRVGQVQTDAADFGFVHDVGRQNLGDHRLVARQERRRRRNGLLGIAGGERRHDGDAVGGKQPADLDRVEPGSTLADDVRNDAPRGGYVRREIGGQARRRFHQAIDGLAI